MDFVVRKGIYLDQSFLFCFAVLMGSYLPRKNSPFDHLSRKVILLMGQGLSESCDHKSGCGAI